MSSRSIVVTRAIVATAVVVVLGGCSRTDAVSTSDETTATTTSPATSESTTIEPTTTVASTVPPTSSAAPTTTTSVVAATTTLAVATTIPSTLTPVDLVLTSNGITPFVFGDDDTAVVSGLATALGAPIFDRDQTYPVVDGDSFLDTTGEEGYLHPFGRTVCYSNDICVQFGGSTTDSQTLTGWNLDSDALPRLATPEGILVGSVWADHPDAITVDSGGCYTTGYGDASGVALTLYSSGEAFSSFDADGNYVTGNPAPADVTVIGMAAGDLPYFLFDDC